MSDTITETSVALFSGIVPAAILTNPYGQPYTIEKAEIPHPRPQEALVQLLYSGVCHGDEYGRDGGGPAPINPVRPLVGGHEGVGTIVAMGTERLEDGF